MSFLSTSLIGFVKLIGSIIFDFIYHVIFIEYIFLCVFDFNVRIRKYKFDIYFIMIYYLIFPFRSIKVYWLLPALD